MEPNAPLDLHRESIQAQWIDYNGHMNVAYYVLVFDHATDALLDYLGMDAAFRRRTGLTTYVLEAHVTYERELKVNDRVRVTTQLLDRDAKRLHYFHAMYHERERYLAATNELILMQIDTRNVKAAPFTPEPARRIDAVAAAHATLPRPSQAGRVIGIGAGRPGRGEVRLQDEDGSSHRGVE